MQECVGSVVDITYCIKMIELKPGKVPKYPRLYLLESALVTDEWYGVSLQVHSGDPHARLGQ